MSINDADIVKAAATLGVLGGGSQTAHRILAALCDSDLGSREIGELIRREPGLAMRVLKVANSAFYGHSRDIGTLEQALTMLGLDAVRGITAAACLDRSIIRRTPHGPIDPKELVNHCVASGFAAEQLARISGRDSPAQAFMAALLHAFGVPVQERLDPEGVSSLIKALQDQPDADALALEDSLVKVSHLRCAEVIFESWQLPESIALAALNCHKPSLAPAQARDLATLVHLGIQLAVEAGFTYSTAPRLTTDSRAPLLESLGMDAGSDDLQQIVEHLSERVLLVANSTG